MNKRCSVVVHIDEDDYDTLLQMEPDISGVLHAFATMLVRGEVDLPRVDPTERRNRTVKQSMKVRETLLESLYAAAYEVARRGDGEWVFWQDLRPALRYREAYGERMWTLFEDDPDIETRAVQHGTRVRRAVRFRPLL